MHIGIVIIIVMILINIIYLNQIREVSLKTILFGYSKKIVFIIITTLAGGGMLIPVICWAFQNLEMFIITTIVLLFAITIQRGIFIDIINKIYVRIVRGEDNIYERDIPKNYSPIMLSFIENGKIEANKDMVAETLNLCSKKCIDISKKEDNLLIKDNEENINLSREEEYIYKWLTDKTTNKYSFKELNSMIKSQVHSMNLVKECNTLIVLILFIVLGIALWIYASTNYSYGQTVEPWQEFLNLSSIDVMLTTLGSILFFYIIEDNRQRGNIGRKYYLYTKSGALLMKKIRKFKRYLKDYSLIKEREIQEIYIWQEYLAYAIALNINSKYCKNAIKELGKYTDEAFEDIYLNIRFEEL